MSKETVNYGNWVPKKMIVALLTFGLICLVIALVPVPVVVRIIFGVLAALGLVGFLYFTYAYHVFSSGGGNLQAHLWDIVIEKLPWDGNGKCLDVGTGNGSLAIFAAKKHPQAEVTGIDYWGKSWNYAQEVCESNAAVEGVGDRLHFQKASAASLPFGDGEFDAIISNFVFHEVRDAKDKRDTIREALRVLRKGGAFSLQDLLLQKSLYGEMDDLLATIRGWGVEEVHYTDSRSLAEVPLLLRTPMMLGKMGLIYGKK